MLQPYPQLKKNSLQCKLEQPKSKTKENINPSSKKKKKNIYIYIYINPSVAIDKNLTIISKHGNTGQKFLT